MISWVKGSGAKSRKSLRYDQRKLAEQGKNYDRDGRFL